MSGACVVLADSAPLGSGSGAADAPSLPERLEAVALEVVSEQLARGRWVAQVWVADEPTARRAVATLRADGLAAVLGPADAAQAVGWQRRNRAVVIGGRLAVCAPWAETETGTLSGGSLVVEIDSGGAFGSGTHPSTRLLAEWLVERVAGGERVLDVGCGSGVLGLAAARSGAGEAVGIDVDPRAVETARANAARNGLAERCTFSSDSVGSAALGAFDLVVTNITADVLVGLAGDIAMHVAPEGALAVSGISAAQSSKVAAAYRRHGIELANPTRLDDWVSLSGSRAAPATRAPAATA